MILFYSEIGAQQKMPFFLKWHRRITQSENWWCDTSTKSLLFVFQQSIYLTFKRCQSPLRSHARSLYLLNLLWFFIPNLCLKLHCEHAVVSISWRNSTFGKTYSADFFLRYKMLDQDLEVAKHQCTVYIGLTIKNELTIKKIIVICKS